MSIINYNSLSDSSDDESVEVVSSSENYQYDENIQNRLLAAFSNAEDILRINFSDLDDDSFSVSEEVIIAEDASSDHLWKNMLTGPILTEASEYFDTFICPISLTWIVDPIRLHKKFYSKEQMEMVISNAAADPNSFGEFTDPYTRKKYSIKMALVVDTEFTKRINSAKTFEKLLHERLKKNWLDTKKKKSNS